MRTNVVMLKINLLMSGSCLLYLCWVASPAATINVLTKLRIGREEALQPSSFPSLPNPMPIVSSNPLTHTDSYFWHWDQKMWLKGSKLGPTLGKILPLLPTQEYRYWIWSGLWLSSNRSGLPLIEMPSKIAGNALAVACTFKAKFVAL